MPHTVALVVIARNEALRIARDPLDVLRLRSLKAAVRERLAALFLRRPEAVLATV